MYNDHSRHLLVYRWVYQVAEFLKVIAENWKHNIVIFFLIIIISLLY